MVSAERKPITTV